MAFTRGLLSLALAIPFLLRSFAAVQPSNTDYWDVAFGARISTNSGMAFGFYAEALLGSNLSVEPGQAVFSDSRPAGYTHFVEWHTPTAFRLTRFHLFAAGDGPVYGNEREFAHFVLKAKRNLSDPWVTVHSFTPTHPYSFVEPQTALVLADVTPIDAQYFRAEFIQWDAGRGFDGPRVIELDGFGTEIPSPIPQSRDDLWDVSSGNVVTSSSGFRGGFASTDIFGSTLSVERGQAIFADGKSNGYTHFVEWTTPTPILLTGFNLFAGGDGAVYNNEREFGQFVLKAKRRSSDPFTTIYSFAPSHPYSFLDSTSLAIVSATLSEAVEAQHFRAEFVQWNAGRGFDGPRVIELDGFGIRLQPPNGPVADWTFEEGTTGTQAYEILDHTDNGHDAPVLSAAFYRATQGVSNGVSLELTSGSHFSPANSADFNFTGADFTLEAIVRPSTGNTEANRGIIVAQNPANGLLSYVLDYRSENRNANFFLAAADGSQGFVTTQIPDDGISHHLAGVRRGSTISIYLDKQLVESKTVEIVPNLPPAGPVALRVGASSAGYWFEGLLDRVRISRGALETPEFIPYERPTLVILEQPQSQAVGAGSNATFSVTVNSNAVASYQWLYNGTFMTGQTSRVLLLTNVQSAQAGNYNVQVSAGGETITSATAQLIVVSTNQPPSDGPVKDDLFDVAQGNEVIRNSPVFLTIRPAGMFGDEGASIEKGSTIFTDQVPQGYTHFIEWRTATPIDLKRIKLFAAGDVDYLNEREFQSFTLKIRSSPSSTNFDRTIYTYTATHPYTFVNPTNSLLIDTQFENVIAQEFRAEFVHWIAGRGYDGPRIIELDGFGERLEPLLTTVADWTFEEGVPGEPVVVAQDSSGRSNHVSRVSGSSAAFVGSGAEVNGFVSVRLPPVPGGIGNALRANDSVDFNLGNEFTLEASINPGPLNADFDRGVIVGQDVASGRLVYALSYRSEERKVAFLIYNANAEGDFVYAAIPNDGKSHHVAGVFGGGVLRIYLDKQLIESKSTGLAPGIPPDGAGRVTLGANDIGGYWWDGTLDRARISRKALSPEEFFPHASDPVTPLVILQPLQDATVPAGGSATFRVVVGGGTNLVYRWTFNGQTLSNEFSNELTLHDLRTTDTGTYRVVVTSGPWEVSSSATLTVTGPSAGAPVITAHPQSRLAGLGFAAQFSVSANSGTPLTYQWFFNGSVIPGETNAVLWVVDVATEDAGTYYVSVGNASGAVLSEAAILNVFSTSVTGGTVYLDNRGPVVDVPVTDDRGVRLTGPEFLAQLYAAAANQPLAPVGPAIPFATGENAGYFWDPIERVVPGTTPGQEAQMEVRAWDSRSGRTFDEAVQNGGLHGVSDLIIDTLGGGEMVPGTLRLMEPFSLASRPRITQQPSDISVKVGLTAHFEVRASGTGPLTYQWKFNNTALAGQTAATLVVSNVVEGNAGNYTVEVRNDVGVTTSAAARLTVLPRDNQAPVVTLTSPSAGITASPSVTLAGSVTDNGPITRVEWQRNGQVIGPVTLSNGVFSIAGILLSPGTNELTVVARDEDENMGSAAVSVIFEPERSLWVGAAPPVQEGSRVTLPVSVSSTGDIGALSFTLSYDTNYLAEPLLTWSYTDDGAFTLVNNDQPGVIHATYVLPGRTIRSGTNVLAHVGFRTRSVPENVDSPLRLEIQGVYSASGDPISAGTTVSSGELRILRRKIVGDNNANDRLDVGDATTIIRMLTLLEPTREWDVTGNDLNRNTLLDPGDAVRVLRAVVNLDPQPTVPAAGLLQQQSAVPASPSLVLSVDDKRLIVGQRVKVRLNLDGVHPITGASFRLNYPTNALRLENAEAYTVGAGFPASAMMLWNLSPDNDISQQSGELNFAASAAASWQATTIAEFNFTVQADADSKRFWPVTVSSGEIATGGDVESAQSFELLLEGREAAAANLAVGSFNADTGAFELRLAGDPGTTYRIESSEDLETWSVVSVITAGPGPIQITDSPTPPVRSRFYRAVEVP